MSRKKYTTDLTDKEWNIIEPMIPKEKPGGRPRDQNMGDILLAECAWALLTHDIPNIKRYIIISDHGELTGHGYVFIRPYENTCANMKVEMHSRQQE